MWEYSQCHLVAVAYLTHGHQKQNSALNMLSKRLGALNTLLYNQSIYGAIKLRDGKFENQILRVKKAVRWISQRRNEGGQGGRNSPGTESLRRAAESLRGRQKIPKMSQVLSSTVHLLPKDIRFEHVDAKLVSCPGRHLTSLRPWVKRTWAFVETKRLVAETIFCFYQRSIECCYGKSLAYWRFCE